MTNLTPIQEFTKIEEQVHENFLETPSKEEIVNFIKKKKLPINDGGISIGIAFAALILQGWSAYREAQKTRNQNPPPPNIPNDFDETLPQQPLCPLKDCREPSIPHFEPNEFICKKGHIWKME